MPARPFISLLGFAGNKQLYGHASDKVAITGRAPRRGLYVLAELYLLYWIATCLCMCGWLQHDLHLFILWKLSA